MFLGAWTFAIFSYAAEGGIQLDPFGRATYGVAACPVVKPTLRWVTLEGCVRANVQRKALLAFVAKQPNVTRVFDELKQLAK